MSYLIKLLFACLLIAGLFFSLFFQKSEPSTFQLRVGLQCGYPPFEFIDEKGEIVGFDVDLAVSLANKMSKTLVLKDMEFDSEILSLQQGTIDLILSGMNITKSRENEILMIPYHGEGISSLSLLFWNKIPESVKSLHDLESLEDATISVEAGTVSEIYMHHFPKIKLKAFQGALQPLMDVKFGKSLANLVEPDVAKYLKSKHPEIQILPIQVPKEEPILGFGIGIKKSNKQLFQTVSQIIQKMKESGELKILENKWFKGEAQ